MLNIKKSYQRVRPLSTELHHKWKRVQQIQLPPAEENFKTGNLVHSDHQWPYMRHVDFSDDFSVYDEGGGGEGGALHTYLKPLSGLLS